MTTRSDAVNKALRWAEVAEDHALKEKAASDFAETARNEKGNWLAGGSDADYHRGKKNEARKMSLMWVALAQVSDPRVTES